MNYREFQKILKNHVSFKLVEKADFLNNVQNYFQPEISKSQFRHPWRKLAFGLAGLVLVAMLSLGLVFQFDKQATLTLDINPSLMININRFNRVLSVEALNPDGELIVNNLRYDSGSLIKVLDEIKYQNIVFGYASESNLTMLFGVSASDYEVESRLKTKILNFYSEEDIMVLVLNKHTEVALSIYSGYAVISAESEMPEYITTTAATIPQTTTAYNYVSSTDNSGVDVSDNFKIQFFASRSLSEEEYVSLAESLGITDAKLQVVLSVFLFYSQFVSELDLERLAQMDLSELFVLYNNAIDS